MGLFSQYKILPAQLRLQPPLLVLVRESGLEPDGHGAQKAPLPGQQEVFQRHLRCKVSWGRGLGQPFSTSGNITLILSV